MKTSLLIICLMLFGCTNTVTNTVTNTTININGSWSGQIACAGNSSPWTGVFSQNGTNVTVGINCGGACNYLLTGTITGTSISVSESSYGLSATLIVNNAGTSIVSGSYTITNPPSGCGICSSTGTISGIK